MRSPDRAPRGPAPIRATLPCQDRSETLILRSSSQRSPGRRRGDLWPTVWASRWREPRRPLDPRSGQRSRPASDNQAAVPQRSAQPLYSRGSRGPSVTRVSWQRVRDFAISAEAATSSGLLSGLSGAKSAWRIGFTIGLLSLSSISPMTPTWVTSYFRCGASASRNWGRPALQTSKTIPARAPIFWEESQPNSQIRSLTPLQSPMAGSKLSRLLNAGPCPDARISSAGLRSSSLRPASEVTSDGAPWPLGATRERNPACPARRRPTRDIARRRSCVTQCRLPTGLPRS
jgi:hypothetical protein